MFSRKRAKNELSRLGFGPHLGVGHAHPSQRSFKKRVFSEGNRHFSAAGRSPNPILSRPELILSHSKSISLSFLTSSLLVFSRFFHLCSYDQYEPLRCRAWASSGSGALLRRCAAPPRPPSRHARPEAATPGPAGPPAAARRCTTPPHPSLEMGRAHCQSASFQEAQGCTAQAAGRSELDRRNAERAPAPPPPPPPPPAADPRRCCARRCCRDVRRWLPSHHGRASGGAFGGRIRRHSARAGGARVVLEPSVRAGGPNRPGRGSCSPHALAPSIRGQQHATGRSRARPGPRAASS